MHSASIDCLINVLNSIRVSALKPYGSFYFCLLSMSSRKVASIGSTRLANSQKLIRMSSSASKRLIMSRASD